MGAESDSKDAQHALVGAVLAERYRVDRFLGSGGMGAVYLGEHVLMRKAVAIKVLHREMTGLGEVVARFEREAVAAGRIDHRNVAAASDFGRLDDGSFYLVLEYVDGRSLSALVDEKSIDQDRALGIAEQVASALVAAHEAGVVHRDLKPDNVMLVHGADGQDLVKVLDFGIAKVDSPSDAPAAGHKLTRIGAIMGTAGYMAPEQALGQVVDHRADLYALGVLLYEMLSGHPPFVAEELSQIVARQLTEKPPPLPEGTPPELSDLVGRLLEKTPGDRPESAAEVKAEIGRLRASRSHADVTARALTVPLIATPPVENESGGAPRAKSRSGVAIAAVIGAVLLGAGFAWKAASGPPEPATSAASAEPSAPLASAVVPEQEPLPSARAAQALPVPTFESGKSVTPAATPTSRTQTTITHSKTTSPDGHTVTTKTTKHTTTTSGSEQKSTHRRTGPGGIYIPPPSEWFK
jgi:serine/threonine protein kinase